MVEIICKGGYTEYIAGVVAAVIGKNRLDGGGVACKEGFDMYGIPDEGKGLKGCA